jgi:hypothetical protein
MNLLYDYDPEAETEADIIMPASESKISVPSPCISICQMDANQRLCTGCYRTIDEITSWGTASDASKRAIWRQIKLRLFAPIE